MDTEGYRKTPIKNIGCLEKFVDRCALAFSDMVKKEKKATLDPIYSYIFYSAFISIFGFFYLKKDCFGNIGVISILHMMPDCMEVWILKKMQKDIAVNQGPKQLEYLAQINTIKPVSF